MGFIKALIEKRKPYLICIDSDGCVFDTMELKHRECFCPALIQDWQLQGISRYVRETMEFVNLYSIYRGANPYMELVKTFELLKKRPEVRKRNVQIPDLTAVETWISQADSISDADLEDYMQRNGNDEILERTLAYSKDGEHRILEMTQNIPPFPYVKDVLEELSEVADILVVSTAPEKQLIKEWEEGGIFRYVNGIAGQETGKKAESICRGIAAGYEKEKVIMLGDAPGDHEAAKRNGIAFYPIIPGKEEDSWAKFADMVLSCFLSGTLTEKIQSDFLKDFYEHLPEKPSWEELEDKF